MTIDNVQTSASPASGLEPTGKSPAEAQTPPSVSILKKGLAKLDISPETVSFTLKEDGSTPDVEHRSFSVTPHPSKGVTLDREPLRPLVTGETAPEEDANIGGHYRNFSADLSSMEEGSTPFQVPFPGFGSSTRPVSRFALESASPVTPCPTPTESEEFEVYEAKVIDNRNPLFGADLTPLPPVGVGGALGGFGEGSKLAPALAGAAKGEQKQEEPTEDSAEFGNENKPAEEPGPEAAAAGPQQA